VKKYIVYIKQITEVEVIAKDVCDAADIALGGGGCVIQGPYDEVKVELLEVEDSE